MAYTYDTEQLERAKRIQKDYNLAQVQKALNKEQEETGLIDEKMYMHEALNMVYSLSDNGIIDFKDKDYAISFILQKVTERVHYINVTLKKELHIILTLQKFEHVKEERCATV